MIRMARVFEGTLLEWFYILKNQRGTAFGVTHLETRIQPDMRESEIGDPPQKMDSSQPLVAVMRNTAVLICVAQTC